MSTTEKKYEMLEGDGYVKTIDNFGSPVTLHRIRALRDFENPQGRLHCTPKGAYGGWVESEHNLSQEGNCWVGDEAWVYGNAQVSENARVVGKVRMFGNARASGDVNITGLTHVGGDQIFTSGTIRSGTYMGSETKTRSL